MDEVDRLNSRELVEVPVVMIDGDEGEWKEELLILKYQESMMGCYQLRIVTSTSKKEIRLLACWDDWNC